VIGVLRVLAFAPDSFEDSDAHVLQLLCELISAAVARARNNAAQELLVDELRSAVAALEESEGRVRRILAGAHEAFVATDELDRITDWNPAAEAHVLGRRGFRATGQADIVGRRLELEVLHRDGRRFPVELTLTANHLRRGIGFSVFLHDISERKHHDAQRERLLQQERAHVERLRELDQIKDRLVSAVSHELRTPLTSITGYVDLLLEEDGLGDDARGFLEVVQRNAERLLRLVGDLLDLYRLDNQGLAAGAVPTELGGLVTRAVDAIRPAAMGKDIDIRLDVQPVIVDGDATRLAQAVDNVLSNAVKYTPEGGSVRVTLAERPGEAWLAIADDGIGIPAADRERLFERFYRSADAVREGVPGTGLGLALTREILNAHGGSIEHADGAEGGSTFVIRLPAPGVAAHAA
jgi:signal transduction histidine kinase